MTGTFPDDRLTLWERLGVKETATSEEITQAYQNSQKTPEQRYAWKALTSRHYRGVYERFQTTAALYDAGFFADQYEGHVSEHPAWDLNFMSTPFGIVDTGQQIASFRKQDKLCVQLITGAFSPLHQGHVQMAAKGRQALTEAGWTVLGTFFAPGNDSYVDTKAKGTAKKNASVRVETARSALRSVITSLNSRDKSFKLFDYTIDPWAAEYMPYEMNFTDHIDRLKAYVNHHVPGCDIEVAFVFGSDNAGFAYAFYDEGLAVCVEREGYFTDTFKSVIMDENPNVLLPGFAVPNYSSTAIRAGQESIHEDAMRIYMETTVIDHPRYLIRDEGTLALKHWIDISSQEVVEEAKKDLLEVLISQVKDSFGDEMQVEILDTEFQRFAAKRFIGNKKTISLDPFYPADYHVGMSRSFMIAGEQHGGSTSHVIRPGTRAGLGFSEPIPDGHYLLVEDDQATGETIKTAKQHIQAHCPRAIIDGVVLLTDFYRHPVSGNQFFDVIDLRDFMVGSLHGGLVGNLTIRDQIARIRMPYMAPYVNLSTRALIPARKKLPFSRALWQANVDFFEKVNGRIADAPAYFQDLAFAAGWKAQDKMVDFCAYHVKILSDQS